MPVASVVSGVVSLKSREGAGSYKFPTKEVTGVQNSIFVPQFLTIGSSQLQILNFWKKIFGQEDLSTFF